MRKFLSLILILIPTLCYAGGYIDTPTIKQVLKDSSVASQPIKEPPPRIIIDRIKEPYARPQAKEGLSIGFDDRLYKVEGVFQ